jgi:hypothetical protein
MYANTTEQPLVLRYAQQIPTTAPMEHYCRVRCASPCRFTVRESNNSRRIAAGQGEAAANNRKGKALLSTNSVDRPTAAADAMRQLGGPVRN